MKKTGVLLLAALFFTGLTAGPANSGKIIVSAAASLSEVLPDLKDVYQRDHREDTITFNFNSSGACYNELDQGGQTDVYISANQMFMDKATAKGLINPLSRRIVAGNRLVLAIPENNPAGIKTLDDLLSPQVSKIMLGNLQTLPVGQYARTALKEEKLWNRLSNKYRYGDDDRKILDSLCRGEADAALIYMTDARIGAAKTDVITFMAKAPQIRYWAAVTEMSKEPQSAVNFVNFLQTAKAVGILKQYGFSAGS